MEVKIECERVLALCQGCLSTGRKLTCVSGHNKTLFIKLREDTKHLEEDLLLCWECVALLQKMDHFQSRIKTAQHRLMQFVKKYYNKNVVPNTLSLIKTTHKQQYDYEYQFIHEGEQKNIILDQKDILPDQKEVIIEYRDEITEIGSDIKMEYSDDIKEEYDDVSFNNDTEDYDEEIKLEPDINHTTTKQEPPKNKLKRMNRTQSKKKLYEKYAKITKKDVSFNKKEHSEMVFLNEETIEQWLNKERKGCILERFRFSCAICRLGYIRELDYFRHITFHHTKSEYPTTCIGCKQRIHSQSQLEEHWRETHTPMLRCKLCGDVTRLRGMKNHFKRSHSKIYTCKDCSLELGSLREFSEHYKEAHEIAVCDYCNKKCMTKYKLEKHIFMNHLPQHCTICDRTYRTYRFYANHLRAEHPELLLTLKTPDSNKELRYCVECDRQFPSVYKYQRHLQGSVKHTPRKKLLIPCPDCGKIFTRMSYKNNHYRLVHMKVTKHYCELCNKYYVNGYGLRKHIRGVHQKTPIPKDKICDLCGRGFSTNRILINHRRTHTGERPFKCEYCPASFAQQTALKTHQKTQHKHNIMAS